MSDRPIIKNTLFKRAGGKSCLAKRIVLMFPDGYENMTYVEPFVGGGSIFFKKRPSIVEVINDLDRNAFVVYEEVKARDINDDFRRELTKEQFNESLNDTSPVRVLERITYSVFGLGKSFQMPDRIPYKKNFTPFHIRLQPVSIFNKDYREIVREYDSPNTFFYLDPPYSIENTKKKNPYMHYTTAEEILECISNIKGKFLLSYNDTPTNRELFRAFNIMEIPTTYSHLGVKKNAQHRQITELLIYNYEMPSVS